MTLSLLATFREGLAKGRTGRPSHRGLYLGPRGGRYGNPEHTTAYRPDAAHASPEATRWLDHWADLARHDRAHGSLDAAIAHHADAIRDSREECMVVLDGQGATLARMRAAGDGRDVELRITGAQREALNHLGQQRGDVTMLHNHNGPSAPSWDDVDGAVQANAARVVITWPGKGGNLRIERPQHGWPTRAIIADLFDHATVRMAKAAKDSTPEDKMREMIRAFNATCADLTPGVMCHHDQPTKQQDGSLAKGRGIAVGVRAQGPGSVSASHGATGSRQLNQLHGPTGAARQDRPPAPDAHPAPAPAHGRLTTPHLVEVWRAVIAGQHIYRPGEGLVEVRA